MPRLFGRDIAKTIAGAMKRHLLPARLVRTIPGTVDSAATIDGNQPASRVTSCRGFSDDARERFGAGNSSQRSERVIVLLGGTLAGGVEPQPGDEIEIEGRSWVIVADGVKRDPAAATYTCSCRSR